MRFLFTIVVFLWGLFLHSCEIPVEVKSIEEQMVLDSLSLTVSASTLLHFDSLKKVYLSKGLNYPKCKFQDCFVDVGNATIKAKIRLKGDLPDHIQDSLWSFKLKLDSSWKGMTKVNFHQPALRSGWKEAYYHFVMQNEGLMTVRYGFVQVHKIDGSGIYAYEEELKKRFIKNNNRSGATFSFSEDELFAAYQYNNFIALTPKDSMLYVTADIRCNAKYQSDAEIGKGIVAGLRCGDVNGFNLEKIALYLVLTEKMNAHHGARWHNLNFFYDQRDHKVEIIPYDGQALNKSHVPLSDRVQFRPFFKNEEFMRWYNQFQSKYSHPEFWLKQHKIFAAKYNLNPNDLQYDFIEPISN